MADLDLDFLAGPVQRPDGRWVVPAGVPLDVRQVADEAAMLALTNTTHKRTVAERPDGTWLFTGQGSYGASALDQWRKLPGGSTGRERNIAVDGATTGATNNAAVIQAAIDACAAAGGGTVTIPRGTWLTGPLKLKTRVRLRGEGFASTLKLINGANAHLLSLDTVQVEQTAVEDLWLDGNAANQSAGAWDVVNLDNTGYNNATGFPSLGDPNHYMRRVSIVNGKRSGVYFGGSYQQSQLDAVLVSDCDSYSFHLAAPDIHLIGCVSRRSGLDGFYIAGNSNRLVNCKAFLAGRLDATHGSGFYVATVNQADLTHCEAQDNRQHGFSLNTTARSSFVACRGDRNGLGADSNGYAGDGMFVFAVTNSRLDFQFGDRNQGGLKQRWAFNSGGSCTGNIVTIVASAGADAAKGSNGSLGSTSVGWARWLGVDMAGAFA